MEIEKLEYEDLMKWGATEKALWVEVDQETNLFRDPGGDAETSNLPVIFFKVPQTDFTVITSVTSSLDYTYDAAGIFLRGGSEWSTKFVAERAPTGEILATSVVTSKYSDDSNGPELTMPVQMRVSRVGNTISWHVQLTDKTWRLVRYVGFPSADVLEVGLLVQTPSGGGIKAEFQHPTHSLTPPKDLRDGS